MYFQIVSCFSKSPKPRSHCFSIGGFHSVVILEFFFSEFCNQVFLFVSVHLFVCLFVFLPFLGPLPGHTEVPKPGVESEL